MLLNAAVTPSSQEQNNSLYAASQNVLGDDEDNEDEQSGEESQKEAEKAREEQQKAAERKEEEAKQTNTSQGPSGSSGSIKMKTKSEGNKRETEIETEKGVYLVRGAFPARKGHPLVQEQREDGARVLCDPAEKVCARLVE